MKLNKSKGKVHPSPSSSSSSSFSLSSSDPISSLNQLLPTAILALISVLSLQDREVLAYMITRSLNPSPAPILDKTKKSGSTRHSHKSPSFDCDCFDCYTAYWFRWDSSPHRELIHQAIEAFEEHLAKTEQPKKSSKSRRREKEKAVRRCGSPVEEKAVPPEMGSPSENGATPTNGDVAEGREKEGEEREREAEMNGKQQQLQQHKGLARKMLPDVIGFFNSRLWNLWGPNV